MRRMIGVGVVLLLLALLIPASAKAQSSGDRKPRAQLGLSYPNPFNPETKIPLTLPDEFFDQGRPVVVSMRIRNVLGQLVAIPAALDHPDGNGVKVDNLMYTTPGLKEAYWDGFDRYGRKVASGMYLLEVVVNGERLAPQKLMVTN